jgi:hypothetical protein
MTMIRRRISFKCIILMLALVGGTAMAQKKASGAAGFDETAALNIAQEWASLVSQANIEGLEKLLSSNYMHIHSTALVDTKAQFIEALKIGSRKYDPITFEDVTVRVFKNAAVVTGKFNLKVLARGKTIEGVNRFGLVIGKTKNGQQVVSYQATTIPQPKQN